MLGWEGSVQKWRKLSKVPVSVFSIPIPASSTQFRNYFSFLERTTRHLASLSADIFFFTNVDVSKIDLHLQSPPSASMASGSFSQLDPMKSLRQAPICSAHCQRPHRLVGMDRCGEKSSLTSRSYRCLCSWSLLALPSLEK